MLFLFREAKKGQRLTMTQDLEENLDPYFLITTIYPPLVAIPSTLTSTSTSVSILLTSSAVVPSIIAPVSPISSVISSIIYPTIARTVVSPVDWTMASSATVVARSSVRHRGVDERWGTVARAKRGPRSGEGAGRRVASRRSRRQRRTRWGVCLTHTTCNRVEHTASSCLWSCTYFLTLYERYGIIVSVGGQPTRPITAFGRCTKHRSCTIAWRLPCVGEADAYPSRRRPSLRSS